MSASGYNFIDIHKIKNNHMSSISRNNKGILSIVAFLAILLAVVTGCKKKEYDTPPVIIPDPTATIDSLKMSFLPDTIGMMRVKTDMIIEGVVSANDESGNIYKNLYIQDSTGGIVIAIDQVDLYTLFKVGQKVVVKCKDLYLGQYGGVTELGYPFNGAIGRIPSVLMASHFYLDGPRGNAPVADTIDVTNTTQLANDINKLIVVKNVRFEDAGLPFVTGDATTNRNIDDATGNPIKISGENFILRTSNYASFCTSRLPNGIGSIRGILSKFNGQYQMYIRDLNDLVKFDSSGVQVTIYQTGFETSPTDWVTYAVSGNNFTYDGSYKVMVGNGYQGTAPSNCYLISPALNLTGYTDPVLTFKTWTKYTDSGLANPFEALISTNYSGSGDPTLATWTPLTCNIPAANSASWTSSGNVSLNAYVGHTVYIGFHYRSSGTSSSSASKWEVDTFKVVGTK